MNIKTTSAGNMIALSLHTRGKHVSGLLHFSMFQVRPYSFDLKVFHFLLCDPCYVLRGTLYPAVDKRFLSTAQLIHGIDALSLNLKH